MYPNSLLRASAVEYVASAGGSNSTVININGGTIAAAASTTNFMFGHTAVNILPGGLTFDAESYTNTIRQSLLNGGGGLVKKGVGTLWLGGVNTYTGPTIVQAGTLGLYPGLSPDNVLTASAVVVSNGASLATDFTLAPGASVELTSLTLNGSGLNVHYGDLFGFVSSTIAFQGPSASGVPLNVSGVNTIRLSGYAFGLGQYPILQFSSRTGSGSFVASLPPGVIGTVATNGNQIVVNITAAPKALSWFGSTDSATLNQNWNTASLNWNFAGAKYSENLGVGDYVTFDDTMFMFFDGVNSIPATNVNLTQPVAPVTMVVNSSYGYVFGTTGSGRITGITTLTKNNTGSLKLLTANDYSGGSTLASGPVLLGNNTALGTGPVTLSGAGLSSDSVTPRTIANSLLLGAATTLGDPINTGTLTWSGPADFGGGARDLNVLSDVVFSGSMTNGGLDEKTGPATLTFSGVTGSSTLGNWQVEDGKLVISGGNLIKSGGGIRIGSTVPGGIARLVITNNAVISVVGGGINARLGNDQAPAADISSTNILDLAGTLAWTTNNGGAIFIGQAGQRAELNLWPGALLQFANFLPGGNTSVVNLNGGTLAPTSSRVDFMQGLTSAWVLPGGVTFDTKGFDVGVLQPLLNGGGGLTKIGNGTLALNGVNSYAGLTTVNGGSLGGTGVISGPVIVGASGTISPGSGIGTLTINNNLTLGGNVLIEINKSLAPASDILAVTGTLSYGGTITVNNLGPTLAVGDSFPVFPPGGTGSVTVVGNAGPGQAFSLNKTTGVISVVASLPSSTSLNYTNLGGGVIQLGWTGAFKLQWQTNAASVGFSTNWSDYPNPSNPVNVTNNPAVPATFFRLINL
jgi:autotransporter-associated beta strand protein